MTSLLHRIAAFVQRHDMFRTGDRVGVAVSGGADSVFLLHALRELATRWNLRLSVVHIEHGIRGAASAADAEFVHEIAQEFGLPFHLHRAYVAALNGNLEQAARRVRTSFYRELIQSSCLDRVATGHTRSDQAETVLYRVLRGSGLAGLAGILPLAPPGVARPLLESTRAEIRDWLEQRSIPWREDETNRDPAYARNRLRHEILPLLAESFNPRLEQALANLATLAHEEENYWASTLPPVEAPATGPLVVPVSSVATVATAVARRLIRSYIQAAKGDLRQIEFSHVERILDLARAPDGHGRAHIPGLDVTRSLDWLCFAGIGPKTPKDTGYSVSLPVPGSVELPGSSARIVLQLKEKTDQHDQCVTVVNELDWQRLRLPGGAGPKLELRNWRPGDKYRRAGRSHEQNIKVLFQEARIPLWERRRWPIITYNGFILWTRRFGAAADFVPGPGARLVLKIDEY
ncbi:MAG TPA: tRNA lysidine(34) synthetase TilS [Bryobacteraceae bacterium]|nr:tRNA lysidine(34) synthetase TilS [Bryobacteraceae bacterium]